MNDSEHFRDTWPAYQRDDIDPFALDTDVARFGWAKPTIYREHEQIHVLLNNIDQLRKRVALDLAELELKVAGRVQFYVQEHEKDGHDVTRGRANEAQAILNLIHAIQNRQTCSNDHHAACCKDCDTHSSPHKGCILR